MLVVKDPSQLVETCDHLATPKGAVAVINIQPALTYGTESSAIAVCGSCFTALVATFRRVNAHQ